ncbi:hypothetical protein [Mucilaginibacter defluvii]|uniref:Uncharacterized protein n=1 Tax=Mucilaginibacter defluvii TaxID=1196019 RepID=A0ABP9FZJ3_9SPHI
MTTVIIKSDSETKTDLLIKLAKELGLEAEEQPDFVELDAKALAFGIGRRATNAEWEHYFEKHKDEKFIDIDEAFSKYSDDDK